MLSRTGQDFLASLERRPFVATREVEAILADAGVARNDGWLDFHERYAGYVLEIGRDIAVLGLIFSSAGEWVDPWTPSLRRGPGRGPVWGIACADAHPSHELVLALDGEFVGGPSERFDVYIEQCACVWQFTKVPGSRLLRIARTQDDDFRARLLERASLMPVAEASDRFTRVLIDDRYLIFDMPEDRRLLEVRERGLPEGL